MTEGSPPGRPSKQKEGTPEGGRRFRGASLERARANEPPDERNLAGEKEHGQPLRSRDRMRQTSSLLPAPHGDVPRQELARAPVRGQRTARVLGWPWPYGSIFDRIVATRPQPGRVDAVIVDDEVDTARTPVAAGEQPEQLAEERGVLAARPTQGWGTVRVPCPKTRNRPRRWMFDQDSCGSSPTDRALRAGLSWFE